MKTETTNPRFGVSKVSALVLTAALLLPAAAFALPPVPNCEQPKGQGSACTEWQETVKQMNRLSESAPRGQRPSKPFNKQRAMQQCIKYYMSKKGQTSATAKATCAEVGQFEP